MPARPMEIERISRLYQDQLAHYRERPEEAKAMATDPLGPGPAETDTAELAAWAVVCGVLLNLDEVLMKG